MASAWKTVRVFISSTFRDMHAERDHLVKVVFPALRERLEKYRIHLVDIDLRWDITEEEAQNDRVLDLCLQQIDECRPFFVGILGERYGWVPESFSDEAANKYGWVQYHTGKSATELEMVYGVLRNPEMHGHGMFFFRDPAFIADLPEAKQCDFRAENEDSAEKLAALKQAIRQTSLWFPPFENYPCRYAGLRINWRLARPELDAADQELLHEVAEDGVVDPQEYRRLPEHLRALAERLGVVRRLVVHEQAHGHGLGEALLATAVDTAHARGLRPVLDMADNLAAAGRLYERAGFERIGAYDLDLTEFLRPGDDGFERDGQITHHLHVLTWIGPEPSD